MLRSYAAVCADTCSHTDKGQKLFLTLYVYSRCRVILDKAEVRNKYPGVGVTVTASTSIIATEIKYPAIQNKSTLQSAAASQTYIGQTG